MKAFTITICVLLIFSHLMLESGAGLQILNHYERAYLNPFWSPWYEWPYEQGISYYHWMQMNAVELMICTVLFCFAKVAKKVSHKVFLIAFIFFWYHVIDWFMMWWDYKTSNWFYVFLNGAIIVSIVCLFIPEKKQGIIKSLN